MLESRQQTEKICKWRRLILVHFGQRQKFRQRAYHFNKKIKLLSFSEYSQIPLHTVRQHRNAPENYLMRYFNAEY